MTHIADWDKAHTERECQCSSPLEDHLEQLEGKDAWREFRKRNHYTPEYYELLASVMA